MSVFFILLFYYSIILLFYYSIILLFYYSIILLFYYSIILLFYYSIILLFYYSFVLHLSTLILRGSLFILSNSMNPPRKVFHASPLKSVPHITSGKHYREQRYRIEDSHVIHRLHNCGVGDISVYGGNQPQYAHKEAHQKVYL